jgi:hypothetical protein
MSKEEAVDWSTNHYMQHHQEKRARRLMSDSSCLGLNAKNELIKACFKELINIPVASIILSSLFSGRTCESVLKDTSFIEADGEGKEYPCLAINLDYGSERWLVISDDLPSKYNEGISILLPRYLTDGLKESLKSPTITHEIQEFLKSLNSGSRYFTEIKVANYLDYQRFAHSISAAELTAAKNTSLSNCVNAQYGQMNIGIIQSKLNSFIDATIGHLSPEHSDQRPPIINNSTFGSNYTPSDKDVLSLFTELIDGIKLCSTYDPDGIKQKFNFVTIYVVMYLTIVTMHRSDGEVFGNLSNFDQNNGFLLIDDKLDSERVVGLSDTATILVKQYLNFIRQNLSRYSMDNFSTALTLSRIFDGKEQVFNLFKKGGELAPFSFQFALGLTSKNNPALSTLKENWARHWVCSKLYSIGVNRDLCARVMGHTNQSEYKNPYSSCSFKELKQVSETIQLQIIDKELKLPMLEDLL